jgi:hypothetical protein
MRWGCFKASMPVKYAYASLEVELMETSQNSI